MGFRDLARTLNADCHARLCTLGVSIAKEINNAMRKRRVMWWQSFRVSANTNHNSKPYMSRMWEVCDVIRMNACKEIEWEGSEYSGEELVGYGTGYVSELSLAKNI